MTVYAITGKMRSGTSAVAQSFHVMGVPVAFTQISPMPPTYRMDWECPELSTRLMLEEQHFSASWLRRYLAARMDSAAQLGFTPGRISIKSPFLAFHVQEVEDACRALGEPLKWIRTQRDPEEVERSLARWKHLDPETNHMLEAALPGVPVDADVPYHALVSHPHDTLSRMLDALELVVPTERLHDAASRILQPTTPTP